jgi:hypothetical protein
LDRERFREQAGLFVAVPILTWALGVAVYSTSAGLFWTILAYLAAFHFVRQQYGFLKLYSRGESHSRWKTRLDGFAIYVATLYPLVFWHAHLDTRKIHWFMEGDFVELPGITLLLPFVRIAWATGLGLFFASELWSFRAHRSLNIGKNLLLAGTAASWWLGIIGTHGDVPFTFTNVIPHGIPYFALLWATGKRAGARGVFRFRLGFLALILGAVLLRILKRHSGLAGSGERLTGFLDPF